LPIVASRVGGIPEMIQDGQNGILVQPEDPETLAGACIQLLNSPEKRIEMGAAGHRIANQKFSIERQVHQLKELYLDQIHAYSKA
jgi:glycosyltransferase involved in cell wall biosynthesis